MEVLIAAGSTPAEAVEALAAGGMLLELAEPLWKDFSYLPTDTLRLLGKGAQAAPEADAMALGEWMWAHGAHPASMGMGVVVLPLPSDDTDGRADAIRRLRAVPEDLDSALALAAEDTAFIRGRRVLAENMAVVEHGRVVDTVIGSEDPFTIVPDAASEALGRRVTQWTAQDGTWHEGVCPVWRTKRGDGIISEADARSHVWFGVCGQVRRFPS
jgi:hypothetical protein